MINFKKISDIFLNILSKQCDRIEDGNYLFFEILKVNKKIWNLEDMARMKELGSDKIALSKLEIDKNNQLRNDIIQKIDTFIETEFKNTDLKDIDKFYSESPGMIIDRLSIMFIRKFTIEKIVNLISDTELKKEYLSKVDIVNEQINQIGSFLDIYLIKIQNKKVYFKIQKAVKIYNDDRIKTYIQG